MPVRPAAWWEIFNEVTDFCSSQEDAAGIADRIYYRLEGDNFISAKGMVICD